MSLLNMLDLTLPLENPVLIFSVVLFIILFAPLILNKFRIPYLIGLIIAGAVIGPYGFNLLLRDSSIVLFGTVGLLYIMFLAGLEMDITEFKRNSRKSIVFGLLTFIIPMVTGTIAGIYILGFSRPASLLLGAMMASHTLIAYPIVSRLGVAKSRAVNITVGGTIITDTLSLLLLAIVHGSLTGEVNEIFWWKLCISVTLFGFIVLYTFPLIGRWFFKRYDDHISQYIFVLGMVFLAAFLAEAAGVEPIIGAFLAGIALNRLIPKTSALMNRIGFVGNAMFIPFFLIGVGMLIDYRTFFVDVVTIEVAVLMSLMAVLTKFAAAWLTQKSFRLSLDERRIIFGLSNARVGATLAIVLIGYNIITGETEEGLPIRLLNDSVLNGAILMILVTCTFSSFTTQRGAQNMALQDASEPAGSHGIEERILIPVNNIETTEDLINLCILIRSRNNIGGMYALNVIGNDDPDASADKKGKKVLSKASLTATAADQHLHELLRYDYDIVNAITSVVKEHGITDLILGLHHKTSITDTFLGNLTEGVLSKNNITTLISRSVQPVATIKRYIILVPDKAEREMGFPFWLIKLWNIARHTGTRLKFYSSLQTLDYIKEIHSKHPIDSSFHHFDNWKDMAKLAENVKSDDQLVVIMSRKEGISFRQDMSQISMQLNNHFSSGNFILIYPMQTRLAGDAKQHLKDLTTVEPIGGLDDIGKTIAKLFRRK